MERWKNITYWTWICIGVWAFLTAGAGRALAQPLIEKHPHGKIDWTLGVVHASGTGPAAGAAETESTGSRYPSALAHATDNLVKVLKRVRIDSTGYVGDLSGADSGMMSQIRDMAEAAEVQRRPISQKLQDGVEVSLRMSLRGGFAQLVLPPEIKSIASLKQVGRTPSATSRETRAEPFSGLIVDAAQLNANPALAPRILGENGEEIYGAAFVSREFAVQRGMTGYAADLETARKNSRVGQNPLIAKALAAEGPQACNIIISNADAARLRKFSEHLLFLKQCRVVIVLRPNAGGNTH